MKILIVGIDDVPHLARSFRLALSQLGHTVSVVDERLALTALDRSRVRAAVWRLLGQQPIGAGRFNRTLVDRAREIKPDMVLVVKGTWILPDTLEIVRRDTGAVLVNYSTDDPFNPAVSNARMNQCLSLWDIYATPRTANIVSLERHCKGQIIHLPFGYDPTLHFPESEVSAAEMEQFRSDLAFVGTCDRSRIPLLESMTSDPELSVALYGDGYYSKSDKLKRYCRGVAVGRAYRLALHCTNVALALLRHTNLDKHTLRTFEIPACRCFMLAERTEEHLSLFDEGKEAEFFSSVAEFLDKLNYYLEHPGERKRIADAGYQRLLRSGYSYVDRMKALVASASR